MTEKEEGVYTVLCKSREQSQGLRCLTYKASLSRIFFFLVVLCTLYLYFTDFCGLGLKYMVMNDKLNKLKLNKFTGKTFT